MRIEHVALWSADIYLLRDFYIRWFNAQVSPLYENATSGFASFFLSIGSGPRLELMQRPDVGALPLEFTLGYAHIAIELGSEDAVDHLAATMAARVSSTAATTGLFGFQGPDQKAKLTPLWGHPPRNHLPDRADFSHQMNRIQSELMWVWRRSSA